MKKLFLLLCLTGFAMQAQTKINFKGTIMNDTLKVFSLNRFNEPLVPRRIPIDENGNFNVAIPVIEGAGLFVFTYGWARQYLYLSDASNPEFFFRVGKNSYGVAFQGTGMAENKLLQKIIVEGADKERDFMLSTSGDEKLKKQAEDFMLAWEKQIKESGFSADAQKSLKDAVQLELEKLNAEIDRHNLVKTFKGKPAPGFSYKDVNDKMVNLSDFRGKYVLIDVWATWCAPCREEMPGLKKIEGDLKGKNIAFIGISIDKPKYEQKWKKFIVDNSLGGTQIIAENAWESTFLKDYGIRSVPTFIIIGPDGNVIDPRAKMPSEGLERQLKKLLRD